MAAASRLSLVTSALSGVEQGTVAVALAARVPFSGVAVRSGLVPGAGWDAGDEPIPLKYRTATETFVVVHVRVDDHVQLAGEHPPCLPGRLYDLFIRPERARTDTLPPPAPRAAAGAKRTRRKGAPAKRVRVAGLLEATPTQPTLTSLFGAPPDHAPAPPDHAPAPPDRPPRLVAFDPATDFDVEVVVDAAFADAARGVPAGARLRAVLRVPRDDGDCRGAAAPVAPRVDPRATCLVRHRAVDDTAFVRASRATTIEDAAVLCAQLADVVVGVQLVSRGRGAVTDVVLNALRSERTGRARTRLHEGVLVLCSIAEAARVRPCMRARLRGDEARVCAACRARRAEVPLRASAIGRICGLTAHALDALLGPDGVGNGEQRAAANAAVDDAVRQAHIAETELLRLQANVALGVHDREGAAGPADQLAVVDVRRALSRGASGLAGAPPAAGPGATSMAREIGVLAELALEAGLCGAVHGELVGDECAGDAHWRRALDALGSARRVLESVERGARLSGDTARDRACAAALRDAGLALASPVLDVPRDTDDAALEALVRAVDAERLAGILRSGGDTAPGLRPSCVATRTEYDAAGVFHVRAREKGERPYSWLVRAPRLEPCVKRFTEPLPPFVLISAAAFESRGEHVVRLHGDAGLGAAVRAAAGAARTDVTGAAPVRVYVTGPHARASASANAVGRLLAATLFA